MTSGKSSNYASFTSPSSTNGTSSGFGGIFENLAKSLNISPRNLVIIGSACILGLIIILTIIIYCIRKRRLNESKKKWRNLKGDKLNISDGDFLKYESAYGFIDMLIMYDRKKKVLKIQNLCIGNILAIGQDIPDCYIIIFMINKDGKKIERKKTKPIYDNLSPSFPEVFSLKVEDLQNCIIYFQVFDENLCGNDYPMGDGKLVLDDLPRENFIGFAYPTYVILEKSSEILGCGQVCVIISLTPPKLTVNLLEAKDLVFQYKEKIKKNVYNFPTVYAIIKIYINGSKKKTFKTKSLTNTRNPYFLESCSLNINIRDIEFCVIKVELHETFRGKIPRRIGRTCIGNQKLNVLINELGQQHLDAVCKNLKQPNAMWHALIKG